ncbi:MAG: hypothetical protein ACQ9MH_02520 [Nitrospinales bacterium]
MPANVFAERISIERVSIDANLHLEESFDYSTYFGVINSPEGLRKIWSHIVKNENTLFFPNAGVSPPPKIDFNNYRVLWFADRGANASFIESVDLVEDIKSGSLTAKIKVWHSDFGSRKLNLWKIKNKSKKIIFYEIHNYDEGP